MRVPTVRVRDDYAPHGFKVINEADVNEFHEIWPDEVVQPTLKRLSPGERVSIDGVMELGIVTIAEGGGVTIENALEGADAAAIAIPERWEDLQWKKQVKLAVELGFEGTPDVEQARAFIAAKSAERSSL